MSFGFFDVRTGLGVATSVSIAAENIATPCLLLTTSSTKSSISFLIVLDDDEGPPQPVAVGGQRAAVFTP